MPITISTMALSKKAGMWWCETRQERHADTTRQQLAIPPRKGSIHEREERSWFGDILCLQSTSKLPLLSLLYHTRCTRGTPNRCERTCQGADKLTIFTCSNAMRTIFSILDICKSRKRSSLSSSWILSSTRCVCACRSCADFMTTPLAFFHHTRCPGSPGHPSLPEAS